MGETGATMNDATLPPGTERIENTGGTKIILAPQPTADPNQPLVGEPLGDCTVVESH